VRHDHGLLRERIQNLSGAAGVARLEAALQRAREEAAAEVEVLSPEGTHRWVFATWRLRLVTARLSLRRWCAPPG
jgi:hypothetical protein